MTNIVFNGASILREEADALKSISTKFHLVDEFQFHFRPSHWDDVIDNWWDKPYQFFVKNERVEGVAMYESENCDDCCTNEDRLMEYGEFSAGSLRICATCGFTKIPQALSELRSLKKLFLRNNNSGYKTVNLPDWIGDFQELDIL